MWSSAIQCFPVIPRSSLIATCYLRKRDVDNIIFMMVDEILLSSVLNSMGKQMVYILMMFIKFSLSPWNSYHVLTLNRAPKFRKTVINVENWCMFNEHHAYMSCVLRLFTWCHRCMRSFSNPLGYFVTFKGCVTIFFLI